jgi:hypothetical protein
MPTTEQFFAELDRRIDSADSPHDEASKERLRKWRVELHIIAAGDPVAFSKVMEAACSHAGVVVFRDCDDFQLQQKGGERMFNLTVQGEIGTMLPSELSDRNKPFGKAWNNFLREIDTAGIKVTDAKIDNAGKTTNLPVDVHAGAGA